MHLLHEFPQQEYPADYLLSRLKARRASFMQDSGSGHSPDPFPENQEDRLRERFSVERGWLLWQLNRKQRNELVPLFLYFEVEILVQCLRCIEAEQVQLLEQLLHNSLLASQIKHKLLHNLGVADVVAHLVRIFKAAKMPVNGLAGSYETGGLLQSEEMIRRVLLSHVFSCCSDPVVLDFFRDLVDMRNTLILAKYIRWQVHSPPELYHGGHFQHRFVSKTVTEEMLFRMIRRFSRGTVFNAELKDPVRLEPYLSLRLLEKMNRKKRISGPVAEVIEYLWRWHVASRATDNHGEVVQ